MRSSQKAHNLFHTASASAADEMLEWRVTSTLITAVNEAREEREGSFITTCNFLKRLQIPLRTGVNCTAANPFHPLSKPIHGARARH